MTIKAVLFDLDGTLLPMDLKIFQLTSGRLFCEKMAAHGYDPQKLGEAQWSGIHAMSANDGSRTNEEAFFEKMRGIYGPELEADIHLFYEFYEKEFDKVKELRGKPPVVVRVQQPKPEETAPQPQKPAEDMGSLPNPDDFDAPKVQREPEERPPEDTAPEKNEKKGFFKKLFGK